MPPLLVLLFFAVSFPAVAITPDTVQYDPRDSLTIIPQFKAGDTLTYFVVNKTSRQNGKVETNVGGASYQLRLIVSEAEADSLTLGIQISNAGMFFGSEIPEVEYAFGPEITYYRADRSGNPGDIYGQTRLGEIHFIHQLFGQTLYSDSGVRYISRNTMSDDMVIEYENKLDPYFIDNRGVIVITGKSAPARESLTRFLSENVAAVSADGLTMRTDWTFHMHAETHFPLVVIAKNRISVGDISKNEEYTFRLLR
jgi:hypothetical protein